MCSITDEAAAAADRAAELAALVAHQAEVGARIAELLRDPAVAAQGDAEDGSAAGRVDVGALPPDAAAQLSTRLLTNADSSAAAASVLVGHVVATTGPGTGTLIGGRYASARRWLEVEARLAPASARAVLGRARDLREQPPVIRDEWLSGRVSGDAVRELTVGVRSMLKPVKAPRAEKEQVRDEAIDLLLPLAHAGTPEDMKLALSKMRVISNPDGATQAHMEAYDDQSLTCVRVGDMSVLTVHLTHENAAAVMTVVDAYARRICDRDPDVVHDPTCPLHTPAPAKGDTARRWCSCGASAAAGVTSKDRWPHLQAVAFTEVFTGFLDDGQVGSHHRVARHVTVQVDAADLAAGLGGTLTIPGQDAPLALPPETVRRMLCDASITPVVVERLRGPDPGSCADGLATLLSRAGVRVLYVGRAERTVTLRMRQAVVARDRHCVFPGCRANPRRCEVHHVTPWEHGGPTDLDNLALLCVRHHHAVHEGGWDIRLKPGATGHETGCWAFTPPRPQP
jgi:hypothetical protein